MSRRTARNNTSLNYEMRHASLSVLDKPYVVMGVINVTPDSFYDGGRFGSVQAAVDHGLRLLDEGADVLDIGGESTRPGALPVAADDEKSRVVPVIEAILRQHNALISIDTSKALVASAALDAGAQWVNDISAGRFDTGMPQLAGERQCPLVLMHSRGTPGTMQQNPHYNDVVAEVRQELLASVETFAARGVRRENMILDPGIGFAKRLEDNVELLRHLEALTGLGFPILIGTSRKSFIGALTGKAAPDRLSGSIASVVVAFEHGAKIFRVHDVAATVDALAVAQALSARG
jgi:dihydropteroate synthase